MVELELSKETFLSPEYPDFGSSIISCWIFIGNNFKHSCKEILMSQSTLMKYTTAAKNAESGSTTYVCTQWFKRGNKNLPNACQIADQILSSISVTAVLTFYRYFCFIHQYQNVVKFCIFLNFNHVKGTFINA